MLNPSAGSSSGKSGRLCARAPSTPRYAQRNSRLYFSLKPQAPKKSATAAGVNRAEGIRLFKLTGRPTKEQFIAVYGPNGPKLTWDQRAAAGVPARQFQAALAAKQSGRKDANRKRASGKPGDDRMISPKPTSGQCRWESALLRASTEGQRSYCSFAYSALACLKAGMSGSASFQSVRKS